MTDGWTIETARLCLRGTLESDAEDIFYEYASGANVGINAGWKRHETIEETRRVMDGIFIGKENVFAIVLKENGKVIGNIGLIDDPRRPCEGVKMLGYALGEAYWGNGYMTEAAKALAGYASGTLHLVLISAYCYPHNRRSRNVLLKLGFGYEGKLSCCEKLPDGELVDNECYALRLR